MMRRLRSATTLVLLGLSLACAEGWAEPASPGPHAPGFTVAVLGDGFADALAEGLRTEMAGDGGVAFTTATRPGPGLTAEGRNEWTATARAMLADHPVDAAVVMIGADDWRPLRDGDTGVADPGTPRWQTLYGDRVAALTALLRQKTATVLWVGLPIVADDATATDYSALNEVARDRAVAAGARFIDSWNAFADENGRFDASGPDKDGRRVLLRAGNGRSFTRAGAVKLATFVEGDLRRAHDAALSALAATTDVVVPREPAFDNDINAQIRRELGLPALQPTRRDAQGPVLIVTAPPRSPGGELVPPGIGPAALPNAGGTSLAQRVIVEGRPLPPKPGRIDDFAWPRP